MKLVSNWKARWKAYSVQAQAMAAAILVGWSQLPDDLKSTIPQKWVVIIAVSVLALGIIGAHVAQPSVSGGKP